MTQLEYKKNMARTMHSVRYLGFLIACGMLAGSNFVSAQTAVSESMAGIYRFQSEVGANAYMVETTHGVILVDAGFTKSDAVNLSRTIRELGKPLLAILLTHAHIDHYGAASLIQDVEDVPIISTARTLREVEAMDATFGIRVAALFGDAVPGTRVRPSRTVHSGEVVKLDGLEFMVQDYGPGESMGDAIWLLRHEGNVHAFVGDIVTGGIHGFFQAGHARDWQTNLQLLTEMLPADANVYPGHGEPGGPELLEWQNTYIDQFLGTVNRLLSVKDLTSEQRSAALFQEMTSQYPDLTGVFLISWSEEIVVRELQVSGAQERLTDRMKQGFGN